MNGPKILTSMYNERKPRRYSLIHVGVFSVV